MWASRAAAIALIALPASAARADSGDAFCARLAQALSAAEARDGFAGITGADAGLYHETSVTLPRAKLCGTNPGERPDAAWRCHLASNTKYIQALGTHGEALTRVEGCLGAGWGATRLTGAGYLRIDELTSPASPARVRVITTTGAKHRLVVAVLSPQP